MANFIERFWSDEDGNTTIDWLVLTAGIVLLGAAIMAAVSPSTRNMAHNTADIIETRQTDGG